MKQLKFWALTLSVLAITFTACESESLSEDTLEDSLINNSDSERSLVTDKDILNTINSLDIDLGVITKGDFHLPDGSVEERIYIGDDITFTKKELELLENTHSGAQRQYRTFNLVTGNNRTINIVGYNGNDQFGLSNKARTALTRAVANYNNISGMTLDFNLTFTTNFQPADMVVYDNSANNPGNSGGVAGFPNSNGEPNKFIQIYGLEGFSTNVNEHVITHEIGHSIGFRHTDWFSRQSCGQNVNEGSAGVGAVNVPGTPTGFDSTSIMLACFSNSVNGNFNGNDITALRAMYPASSGSICDGVSEFQSGVFYPVGSLVTYFGNLFERTNSGWTFLGAC